VDGLLSRVVRCGLQVAPLETHPLANLGFLVKELVFWDIDMLVFGLSGVDV
jgi:hypothetical protein